MPDPSEHAQDRPALERMLQGIPGFQGYLQKEYRRKSDDLQRDWLAGRLERAKQALGPLTRPLADAGRIDVLPRVDMLRGRIDKLIARIRGAVQGYSGFFDLVQVNEELLDAVYDHDVYLMDQVDELAQAVEGLPGDPDQLAAALDAIDPKIDAVDREMDVRTDMLQGLA
jgi:hypothetical protein